MQLSHIDHIVIDTSNLENSLKFYGALPGVNVCREKGRGVARIGRQKINIHAYPPTLSPVAAYPAVGHQTFCVCASGSRAELEKNLDSRIQGGHPDACEHLYFHADFCMEDPDGNSILIQIDPALEECGVKRIMSLSIPVSDMEKSAYFYGKTLGLKILREGEALICPLAYGALVLVQQGMGEPIGSCDFCLITDQDIETVYEELKNSPLAAELGITQREGALGPIRSVYLRDPDGNLVEIAQYMGNS